MEYTTFQDLKLSALGLGVMRMPVIDGDSARIDEEQAAEMIAYALENGINYFDTAWAYHGGKSQEVLGRLLAPYPRDSYYLATKFPGYAPEFFADPAGIFEAQLKQCQTDYFDFYLLHNLWEKNIDAYLEPDCAAIAYLLEQKAAGRIRHLGFSTHGSLETMERFLQVHGKHMEFCQIQLNYLDWEFQKAKEKVELLRRWNLPIWVMEPLRGGKLATLPESAAARLAALRPEEGIPAWGFHFLRNIPGVTMILSGMSNMEQLQDNIRTFSAPASLSPAERETLLDIAADLLKNRLPCTACRYCTEECPQQLDIPALIGLYNDHILSNGLTASRPLRSTLPEVGPDSCIGCGKCTGVCPQNIRIPDIMADFAARLAK